MNGNVKSADGEKRMFPKCRHCKEIITKASILYMHVPGFTDRCCEDDVCWKCCRKVHDEQAIYR